MSENMELIDRIVDIKITKNTLGITSSGFDTLLILGDTKKDDTSWITRVKEYSSTEEVLEDYANNNAEYLCASIAFSQQPRLNKVLIGQCFSGESFIEAYNKLSLEEINFYGLVITSKDQSDQLALSEQIETENKLFGISNDSSYILDPSHSDDIASQLKELNRERTFVFYNKDADVFFPEAAWFGLMLAKDAGSATWAYKSLIGIRNNKLTTNQISSIEDKNANYNVLLAGRDVVLNGKTSSGEYIDIVQGLDWLVNQMQMQIANVLLLNSKIPYTNQGIAIIESMVRNSINSAADRDIVDRESIKVTVPNVRDISQQDKQDRRLPDVKFEARLAGAIHKVSIQGIVSL